MGEIQSCLFGSRGVFIWFIPCLFSFPFLCLQLEQSFRWERFPNLCCEAVKPQGRCRFLWESALLISGDAKAPLNGISSARTLLANLLQGIPKEKGKKKPLQKKTPGSDSAVGISSHLCSVVSFRLVFLFL